MAFKPGVSGNPAGRPPGATLAGRLREAVGKDFDDIVQGVIDQAKGGDIAAANLLISRVCPALKPIYEPMRLDVSGVSLSERAAEIMGLIVDGKLSPTDGKQVLDGLAVVGKIYEVNDLIKRIEVLEERQNEHSKSHK